MVPRYFLPLFYLGDKRKRYFPESRYGEWFHLEDQRYFHYSRNTCRYRSCYKHSRIYPGSIIQTDSANQNDLFHLEEVSFLIFRLRFRKGRMLPGAGLMANLFWYDAENGVLVRIQTVTVSGAFERSIPYADLRFQRTDYFIAFGTRIPQWQSYSHRRKYHRRKWCIPATCRHKNFVPFH